jgi:hypothetical protein
MIVPSLKIAGDARGFLEAPANAISFDRIADPAGGAEAKSGAGRRRALLAPLCLQDEGLAAPAHSGPGALEIGAPFQSREPRRAVVPTSGIFGVALAH